MNDTATAWQFEGESFRARLERLYALTAPAPDGPRSETAYRNYAAAQEEVLSGLLALESKRAEYDSVKHQRTRKEREHAAAAFDTAERLLRRTADAIAHHMVGGQIWILRRLHTGERPPRLRSSNWETVAAAARRLNAEPQTFALMSDITTFISIGDLFVARGEGFEIIEVKSGKVNEEILSSLEMLAHGCELAVFLTAHKYGEAGIRQAERIFAQASRAHAAVETINAGRGTEGSARLRISTGFIQEVSYADRLSDIIGALGEQKPWSIGVVDRCLFVGAYTGTWKSGFAFDAWMKADADTAGPTFDLRAVFRAPLVHPLQIHPEMAKWAAAVAFGDVRVLVRLAVPRFVKLAEEFGLESAWLSKAETERVARLLPRKTDLFRWEGRGLSFAHRGRKLAVATGAVGRMVYGLETPSCAIETMGSSLVEWMDDEVPG